MASPADHDGGMEVEPDPPSRPAIDRRLFILGLAATAACGDSGDGTGLDEGAAESTAAPTTAAPTTTVPPTTAQPPTTLAPAPTTTTEPPLPDTEVDRALLDADLAAGPTHFVAAAATYVVAVPTELREPFKANLDERLHPGIDAGYLALFDKCTHLGCKAAPCAGALTVEPTDADGAADSAGDQELDEGLEEDAAAEGASEAIVEPELTGETIDQFYCPCHASVFSILGEYRSGPAVSGLYHFPIELGETAVTIQASTMVEALPRDVDLSGLPTGLNC